MVQLASLPNTTFRKNDRFWPIISRVGPDTFQAGYWIPDIRLIAYAGYPSGAFRTSPNIVRITLLLKTKYFYN